jgi:poly(beta-D-mannuronate) C5 epimerase
MTPLRSIIRTAILIPLLGPIPGVYAQAVSPEAAAQKIREAILEVDRASTPGERVTALEVTSYHIGVLDRLTRAREEATSQRAVALLRQLGNEGVDADLIAYWTVVSRLASVGTVRDAETQIAAETSAYTLAETIANPVYRAASIHAVGRAFAPVNQAATRRAVDRLLEVAPSIRDSGERTAAANFAAKLAAQIGGLQEPAVLQAIGIMETRRSRGQTWYVLARQAIGGTEASKANDAELATRAKDALAKRDRSTALRLTLALSPSESKSRSGLLKMILDAAVADADFDIAQRAALAFTDEDDEEAAVEALTARLLDRGEPLRAAAIVERVFLGTSRADALTDLAAVIDRAGYSQIADGVFDRAVASTAGAPQSTANVVRVLANTKRLERAVALAEGLPAGEARSMANGAIAKRLSDIGRIDEAQSLLPTITTPKDRSNALSGIARAKVRQGDQAAGRAALADLIDDDHRDRVLGALVNAEAQQGSYDAARKTALEIVDIKTRLAAFLDLFEKSARQNESRVMRQAIGQAVELAKTVQDKDRDALLFEIVEAQAKAGDVDGAATVADSIVGTKLRDKARAEIVKGLSRKKRVTDAGQLLRNIAADEARSSAIAALVPAQVAAGGELVPAYGLLREIRDDRSRRQAMRATAEAAAARLDVSGKLGPIKAEATAGQGAGMTLGTAALQRDGFEINRVVGAPSGFNALSLPATNTSAADVRARVPAARNGRASLALMSEGAQFSKFFEELPGGRTGIDSAIQAQKVATPRYISIDAGVVSLRDLEGRFGGAIRDTDDALLVTVPILIAPGATLVITALDAPRVRLGVESGAFIINAGNLYVVDSRVESWSESRKSTVRHTKAESKSFRPFIVSWSGSETYIADSTLAYLGYQSPKAFGLSISAGPSNITKRASNLAEPTGIIVDNLFDNLEYGFYSYEASAVQLVGNEYRDNVIYAVDPHDRSHGLVIAYNTTYGSQEKHGIIVSREVDRSFIVGNVALEHAGSGFMLDRDSVDNIIYANTAFKNKQDGITLFESSCNLIVANQFSENKRDGVKVRNSWDVGIYSNTIRYNQGAGIGAYIGNLRASEASAARDYELDPYVPVTTLSAGWNEIAQNSSGISLSGVTGATLIENQIRLNPKRLYAGDVGGATLNILQLAGRAVVRSTCRPKRPAYQCGLRDQGLLGDDGSGTFFDPNGSDDCTDVDSSLQSIAYKRKPNS